MSEYINREKLNDLLDEFTVMDGLYNAIQAIPTEYVTPVKHGYWKPIYSNKACENIKRAMYYECSECGCSINDGSYTHGTDYEFCPYCGTKMDMDGENNE